MDTINKDDYVTIIVGPLSGSMGTVVEVHADGKITVRTEHGGEVRIEARKCRRI